jgi:hypothetical protein
LTIRNPRRSITVQGLAHRGFRQDLAEDAVQREPMQAVHGHANR